MATDESSGACDKNYHYRSPFSVSDRTNGTHTGSRCGGLCPTGENPMSKGGRFLEAHACEILTILSFLLFCFRHAKAHEKEKGRTRARMFFEPVNLCRERLRIWASNVWR